METKFTVHLQYGTNQKQKSVSGWATNITIAGTTKKSGTCLQLLITKYILSCISSQFSIAMVNGTCTLRAPILLCGDVPAIKQLKLQTNNIPI